MRRFSCGRMIRNLTHKKKPNNLNQTSLLVSSSPAFISKPLFAIAATAAIEMPHHRTFCSGPDPVKPSGPSNLVVVNSEETFNDSLRKVQDEALPGILYFTAAWCGPCRFMSPVLEKLSESYPHVTTYKIDIDQSGNLVRDLYFAINARKANNARNPIFSSEEALGKKLSEMSITSIPTLHFFKDGKKASELVGFDVQPLKETMAKLYD